MEDMKNQVIQTFSEVREVFPFPVYVGNQLSKYIAIITEVMNACPSGSKILSIGSGTCFFEAILSKLGYDITAIDDLKDQWYLIGKNKQRIKNFARQMEIELIVQSADSSQLREDYFDAALLINLIEHLHRSPRQLLNYSLSSLKPGGLLLIETPNAAALVKRFKVLFGKSSQANSDFFYWNIGEYRGHVREYTQSEIKRILSYHNLETVDSKMMNILVEMDEDRDFFGQVITKAYKLISGLYPNFRDTILIWGKKPKNWDATDSSVAIFRKHYPFIQRYNLDNEPDEVLIKKMKNSRI